MPVHLKNLDNYDRELLSNNTHQLLCTLASGDLQRPLPRVDVDWEELYQAIGRNGLLGLTNDYLERGHSKNYPPPNFKKWISEAHRSSAIRLILMYMKVMPVIHELNQAGLDYMVIKGPALAHLVYPDPTVRGFNDLDLLIREQDWEAMHQLLLKLGFAPEKNLPHPPPKITSQDVIYELKYWHIKNQLLVEVHYDDLLNAGLASRNFEGFWQRAVQIEIDGVPLKTLCLEDQLIHLSMHAHYHGYTRLNWFSDIGIIIRHHFDKIDWDSLLDTAEAEEAQVGVYYSLYFLDKLLDIPLPAYVLHRLRPNPFRRWWHEYYLPEKKVLSLEPMFRPDFSFYFTPLFKRFIPDFLVMGRRRDKIWYLSRLLTPSAAWLKHYYRLSDDRLKRRHHLLHPLKLLLHYLLEIILRGLLGHKLFHQVYKQMDNILANPAKKIDIQP